MKSQNQNKSANKGKEEEEIGKKTVISQKIERKMSPEGKLPQQKEVNVQIVTAQVEKQPDLKGKDVLDIGGDEDDSVPVRDEASRVPQGSEKLRRMVSEVFAKHQDDMEYIRSLNLGLNLPESDDILKLFRQADTRRSPIPVRNHLPRPTGRPEKEESPPQLHFADSPDATPAPPTTDPFNFISTLRRKLASERLPHNQGLYFWNFSLESPDIFTFFFI